MNSNESTHATGTETVGHENGHSKALKFIIGFVIAALVSTILVLAIKSSTESTIQIENPVIEQIVCSQLNIEIGYITKAEAASITELDLSKAGVEDFSELVKLPSLHSLDLSDNHYSEIILPEGLKLEALNISGNRISDLSFLSSLHTLKTLTAEDNLIKDISPLSGLTALTSINLNGNLIRDIAPIASLAELEELSVSNNRLIDISPVSQLTALKALDLSNNQISDISPINTLTTLESLNLNRNPFKDLSPIAELSVVQSGNVTE